MLSVTVITLGNLKESYLREACAEYGKRLGGFCRAEIKELKEVKLSDTPSAGEIHQALEREADAILAALPPKSYKIALCIEGEQLSSEGLAELLDKASLVSGHVCFLIGSSHGLSPRIKALCDKRLSFSKLTFPHQLMRVILLEAVYRALNIQKGTKYHK